MSLSIRLALREIRNHPRFSAFFTFNLALGLTGFVVLDAFDASMQRTLTGRSQAYLTADVEVSSPRRLEAAERAALDAAAGPGARISRAVELFSMAGGSARARLTALSAVDSAFPLYGSLVLDGAGPVGAAERRALEQTPGVWVDPVLLAQLGLDIGDEVAVGSARFRILDTVARDGGRATSGFSIAPRLYLARQHLAETDLLGLGSRVRHRRLYRLAEGADLDAAVRAMRRASADPLLQVRSHEDATRDLARTYGRVARYLGLVSLIAAFLAGLGSAYLFRAFLTRRLREVAILLSLGATRPRAQLVFVAQLWLLALAAASIAAALGAALLPAAARLAAPLLPGSFAPRVGWETLGAALLLALLGSTAACLPLLHRIRSLRPAQLFAEHARPALRGSAAGALLWLPALALFWSASVWRAGDLRAGSLFVAVFGVALVGLVALGQGAIRALASVPPPRGLGARLALRRLARSPAHSFAAVALCALLVSLAPQLRAALDRDLERPAEDPIPSLFLFDIQPDQVEPLSELVAGRGARLDRISPLVRARLDAINGDSVRESPSEEPPSAATRAVRSADAERRRLRSRRYNLTYRAADASGESGDVLRAGRPFAGSYDPAGQGAAELSLEVDFARRLGVGLDDRLTFDVQGVPVEGRVVGLREVRWTSFQPNFFVAFQPGVLEPAPKVFVASVPQLPTDARESLQAAIVADFPNVSAVDVTRAVGRLLALIEQLQWALASTASLSLAVGLLLVFTIARDQARARRWETNLLKVLGADLGRIARSVDLEFGLLGALATLAGSAVSVLASAALSFGVLDAPWTVAWTPLLWTVLVIPSLCALTARVATRSVLRERPLVLLQAGPD